MPRLIQPLPYKNPLHNTQKVWLFDLDNTLHDASHAVFSQIDKSMTRAVMQSLHIDYNEATQLRQRYWERYGATMIGMHRHHGVDPLEFLHLSHDFDIPKYVKHEPRLAYLLTRVPGIKYVLTNAPYGYARQVLQTLGIEHCFAGICAIDQMYLRGDYHPKPSTLLFKSLLHELQTPARQVVLVEDTLKNLKAAKRLGMQCAHIYHPHTPFSATYDGRPGYVDIRVHSIQALLLSDFALSR
ncbi:pyrimidine 5'-nucleotidase [Pelistega europaea]|uniref:Pyrimidine 5'-nucleotidase n=1 Tax=Pelistega europaea TaxID=106147 RepID=A0A7Y4LAH9_9BURK|nr:pyrimidine 5'-nucleotidase [Pelistega europaea]NOL49938.1 pyrimidine 5'-nucleotidase [Pelistega europaea]